MLLLLLNGCAYQQKAPQSPLSISDTYWQLRGKFSVRSKEKNVSAKLHWLQCEDLYFIRLSGPLGRGAVKIVGDNNRVTLVTADGVKQSADNAQELLEKTLGWSLPIEDLRYWIRGIEQPQNTNGKYSKGLLRSVSQSDWQINIAKREASAPYLPEKISLSHPTIKSTVLISHWGEATESVCNTTKQ